MVSQVTPRQEKLMEEEYEVPSPHEHAIEEAGENRFDSLVQKVALMTAILATIGALISYQSGSAQNEAMFLKNQSILKQAEASDQFAFYQAKSVKSHIDEAVASLSTEQETKARYLAAKLKEDNEKTAILVDAQKLQAESKQLGEESAAKLKPHERLAIALTFIQVAIALAAITVLTRRRWLLWGSVSSAVAGMVVAVTAFI
jgi:hypothetical protein